MAWGHSRDWMEHDVLLSVSEDGELAFWVPETNGKTGWRCTGKVRTCRTGFRKVRCSSAKKTALSKSNIGITYLKFDIVSSSTQVVGGSKGDELTIWDSTESEFASGLEYCGEYKYYPIFVSFVRT